MSKKNVHRDFDPDPYDTQIGYEILARRQEEEKTTQSDQAESMRLEAERPPASKEGKVVWLRNLNN